MKQWTKDILMCVVITLGMALTCIVVVGNTAMDIQLQDTKFVFDGMFLALVVVGPLTVIIFLSMALTRKFRVAWINIALIVDLLLISLIIFRIAP
jgi:hypothetical protein